MFASPFAPLAGRLALDVVCLILLAGGLYRPRRTGAQMLLVLTALNLGLFAAVTVISTNHFPAGVGFGLFGLLSLIRLRSTTFALKDIAYTFVALVLALVNALPSTTPAVMAAMDLVLLAGLWMTDGTRNGPETRRMTLTLDRDCVDATTVRQLLADQLPPRVVALAIDHVDHVRGRTVVTVRHEVDGTWPHESSIAEPARASTERS
jgi:hypothetical protein